MIDNNRFCILGLPRSGTQYTANLIEKTFNDEITDLVEPFCRGENHLPVLDEYRQLSVVEGNENIFLSMDEQVNYMKSVFEASNKAQPIIFRFVVDKEHYPYFDEIVKIIKNADVNIKPLSGNWKNKTPLQVTTHDDITNALLIKRAQSGGKKSRRRKTKKSKKTRRSRR
jgi:hypothetical protein